MHAALRRAREEADALPSDAAGVLHRERIADALAALEHECKALQQQNLAALRAMLEPGADGAADARARRRKKVAEFDLLAQHLPKAVEWAPTAPAPPGGAPAARLESTTARVKFVSASPKPWALPGAARRLPARARSALGHAAGDAEAAPRPGAEAETRRPASSLAGSLTGTRESLFTHSFAHKPAIRRRPNPPRSSKNGRGSVQGEGRDVSR